MTTTITKSPAKYRLVEEELRREINSGLWLPGERLPGEYELAKRFDVAYMTLRQAIAGLIDEGLLRRVNGKGTFVADLAAPLALGRPNRPMALLIPSTGVGRDGYYFPELLSGFQSTMEQQDMHIVPYNCTAPEPPGILVPGSAIACLLTSTAHFGLVERLRDSGFPVLAINRYTGRRTIPCVRVDDKRAVQKAVSYLVELGHRKLGFVSAVPDNIDARERLRGFRAAVARLELPAPIESGADFSESAGYSAARHILGVAQPPTAIVCASDLSALGVLQAARELGMNVPGDLSVVGFGDFSVANYAAPRLTTIRQDRLALGRKGAECLVKLANDEEVSDVVIGADLVIRDSAAPIGV
ncbi:MAG: GntR family transcriptional regulator [Capsulimonadaceae bacterium]|nr:GntR family transcriptional regulator [Capsulimonadaceae bacterium]